MRAQVKPFPPGLIKILELNGNVLDHSASKLLVGEFPDFIREQVPKFFSKQLLPGLSGNFRRALVDVDIPPLLVENGEPIAHACQDLLSTFVRLFQLAPRFTPGCDVVKHQHHTHDAASIQDWRGSVLNRALGVVPRDKNGVIRQRHGPPFLENLLGGGLQRLPCALIHDLENLLKRFSLSLTAKLPAG